MCLRVSVAAIKHHDQKRLADESVYFELPAVYHNPLLKEVRTGNWRQNLTRSQ